MQEEDSVDVEESKKSTESSMIDEKIDIPEQNPILVNIPDGLNSLISEVELTDEESNTKEYPIVINEDLQKVNNIMYME